MSVTGYPTGTPVLCLVDNGTPEHTTGTGCAPGPVTSEGPVAVELCILTSGASIEKPSGGIQHGLQSVLKVYRGTHKDRVTLIQLGDDYVVQINVSRAC